MVDVLVKAGADVNQTLTKVCNDSGIGKMCCCLCTILSVSFIPVESSLLQ